MRLSDPSQINKEIGNIRVAMFMISYLGTVVIGAILDKTKKFKLITLINSATFLLSYGRVFYKKLIININIFTYFFIPQFANFYQSY